ncbi:PadR family transcriptional regulator [Jiangella endophytica]|uniref:PadR family transcriptional regulator n=1 Tax=Jiangella endophytica TaxID=1623398 RepID=UPI000E350DEA|nr:helix-turn-helix transcriptional regulator [Jiangella endophytica]
MKADALRGNLDALILAVVRDRPLHGYGVSEALSERSDGAVDLPTGTLYPALRRLERLGYLRSSWETVGGRKRRTYEITRDGRGFLATQQQAWSEMSSVMNAILGPA